MGSSLPKQSQISESILKARSRYLGLFWKEKLTTEDESEYLGLFWKEKLTR